MAQDQLTLSIRVPRWAVVAAAILGGIAIGFVVLLFSARPAGASAPNTWTLPPSHTAPSAPVPLPNVHSTVPAVSPVLAQPRVPTSIPAPPGGTPAGRSQAPTASLTEVAPRIGTALSDLGSRAGRAASPLIPSLPPVGAPGSLVPPTGSVDPSISTLAPAVPVPAQVVAQRVRGADASTPLQVAAPKGQFRPRPTEGSAPAGGSWVRVEPGGARLPGPLPREPLAPSNPFSLILSLGSPASSSFHGGSLDALPPAALVLALVAIAAVSGERRRRMKAPFDPGFSPPG